MTIPILLNYVNTLNNNKNQSKPIQQQTQQQNTQSQQTVPKPEPQTNNTKHTKSIQQQK